MVRDCNSYRALGKVEDENRTEYITKARGTRLLPMGQPPEELPVIISDAVADSLETPMEELPPLSDSIDLDALETLLPSTANDPPSGVAVSFRYAGLRVHVYSGYTVYARPVSGDREEPVDVA